MATNPLETFTASEIQDEELSQLPMRALFEVVMRRVESGYENMSEAFQVLRQTDTRGAEYILGRLASTPDLHLTEISAPATLVQNKA